MGRFFARATTAVSSCDREVSVAARRRRRGRSSRGRSRKQNVSWANNSATTPVNLVTTVNEIELVPNGMTGVVISADFRLVRIVGSLTFTPQTAAVATAVVGYAFVRTLADELGIVTTLTDPLSTDVDAGSQDILHMDQFTPNYGAQLTATALDLSVVIHIDIKVGRKLDKRNGIMLFVAASVNSRTSMTHRLRILTALN